MTAGGMQIATAGVAVLAVTVWLGWLARPAPPMADRPIPPLPAATTTTTTTTTTGISILAFGTSLTAHNPWPDELAAQLQSRVEQPVTVNRLARDGAGSAWALTQVDQIATIGPDIVLIEFAANDADLLDGVSPARSARQHTEIITGLQAALPDTRIVLMTMNPVSGLHRILRARLGRYHAMYGTLAARHDVALLDLNRRWKDSAAGRPPDGLHPSPSQTAQIIAPAVSALITASVVQDQP